LFNISASFDYSVKIWDASTGKCVQDLTGQHSQAATAVEFSPDGKFVCSGGQDGKVVVWSVKDGSMVEYFRGTGAVTSLGWCGDGSKIAASFTKNAVCVFDFNNNK
jgi:WD40 repeat protein